MKKSIILMLPISMLLGHIDVGNIEVDYKRNNQFIKNSFLNSVSKEFMNNFVSHNKDISSILKYNPSVTYDTSNNSSFNGANIRPDKISIQGNLYYQNNFSLDGVDITNDIEPAISKNAKIDKADEMNVETPSLGVNVNTDILESIEVYDSFVPAKYGKFAGGVVDSKTKNPENQLNAYINFGFTSSKLTKTLYPDCENSKNKNSCENHIKNFLEDKNKEQSKIWKKYKTNFGFSTPINEDLGVLFAFTDLRSITTKAGGKRANTSTIMPPYKANRISQNFLLKFNYELENGLILTPSIIYAPSIEEYNFDDRKNGKLDLTQKNIVTKLNALYSHDNFKINSNISYSQLNLDREVETNVVKAWKYSNIKNWGKEKGSSYEGHSTNFDRKQNKLSYDIDTHIYFDNHTLNAGFDFESINVKYGIAPNSILYTGAASLGNYNCTDNETCSKDDSFKGKGQFFKTMTKYNDEQVKINTKYYGFYLEDEFDYKDFSFRIGTRADYNALYKNFNIAPRFKADYNFNEDSKISIGLARYYGRMPYAYKIKSQYKASEIYTRKTPTDPWTLKPTPNKPTIYGKLKTPYSDEFAFAYHQKISNMLFDFKYVYRDSKDQILTTYSKFLGIKESDGKEKQYFANLGKSKNHNLSLSISNAESIEFFGIKNDFAFITNRNYHKRNLTDYNEDPLSKLDKDSQTPDKDGRYYSKDEIMYDGKVIKAIDKPVFSFNKPLGFRVVTNHKFNHFTLTNFFNYEHGYKYEKEYDHIVNDTTKLRAYEIDYQKSSIIHDMKIKYENKVKKVDYHVSLDINNVFNTRRIQSSDGMSLYPGRSFYIEVGAKF